MGRKYGLLFLCVMNVWSCDLFGPDESVPASIEIIPNQVSLAVGDSIRLTYVVRDRMGRPISDKWAFWNYSDAAVITLNEHGRGVARANGMVRVTADCCGLRAIAHVAVGEIRFDNVHERALSEYERRWGLRLTHVPIVIDDTEINTNAPRPASRFFTVVYGDTLRWEMLLFPDGRILNFRRETSLTPAGVHRIGVAVIDNPLTDMATRIEGDWQLAIDSVNADWRSWFRSRGSEPLTQLDLQHAVAQPGELDSNDGFSIREFLDRNQLVYDFPAVMHLGRGVRWGGLFRPGPAPFVLVGCSAIACADPWDSGRLTLSMEGLHETARILLHHEIGHAMGWHHYWGGGPTGTRLITHPELLGLTDLTGNGIIELLSPTPYGSSGRLR